VTVSDPANRELEALARLGGDLVSAATGVPAAVVLDGPRAGDVQLRLTPDSGSGAESYHLVVSREGVTISSGGGAGLFYGLQTLRQLLEARVSPAGGSARGVPAVAIHDGPRFLYRGLHLDVARHFFPPDFVKRYIDLMAQFKMNRFHWHLTDDQGWRIEIARFPSLTSVGACRRETMVEKRFNPYVGDGMRYCGFYTQEEIREIVAYARSRYVTIVPEIEMPGHAKAALAAFPELACTPGPFEVRTTWGVDDDVFCPSDSTFAFIEGVLTEVMQLFPGEYIHIGGDEVPKTRWRASALAQELMRREGLKDENELQSYFIRRVERFLRQHNRRLIGWDEILEGGLAPEATVMSWRGTGGGIAAAREGHHVVMTPNSPLYFDHYQGAAAYEPLAIGGLSPLERVYAYEPIPDSLTVDQARHILGAQANVWTEYLKTPAAVEYMVYPRALALAEVVWSPRERRDWASFAARLPFALRALDRLAVPYRVPHVEGLDSDRLTLQDHVRIELRTLIPGATIRLTTDGSDPDSTSAVYDGPLSLPVPTGGLRVTARAFLPNGRSSPLRAATFTRTTHRAADALDTNVLAPGLRYAFFAAAVRSTRAIDTLVPAREEVTSGIALRGDERAERYALRLMGYVRVPRAAMYEFALESDDGSTLSIGDRIVVDNDGLHGTEEKIGMIALRGGHHPITVRYFQGGGGASLGLRYRIDGGPWQPLPAEWLAHPR
jgi:hexosaminidase